LVSRECLDLRRIVDGESVVPTRRLLLARCLHPCSTLGHGVGIPDLENRQG